MQVIPFPFKRRARIEMVPLIDMFFLLLVFFIFGVFSMTMQQGIHVELPSATTAATEREALVTVSVTEHGELFVNKEPVTREGLGAALLQRGAGRLEEPIVLNADRRVAHGVVMMVLDAIREAGIQHVSFQTEPIPQ